MHHAHELMIPGCSQSVKTSHVRSLERSASMPTRMRSHMDCTLKSTGIESTKSARPSTVASSAASVHRCDTTTLCEQTACSMQCVVQRTNVAERPKRQPNLIRFHNASSVHQLLGNLTACQHVGRLNSGHCAEQRCKTAAFLAHT